MQSFQAEWVFYLCIIVGVLHHYIELQWRLFKLKSQRLYLVFVSVLAIVLEILGYIRGSWWVFWCSFSSELIGTSCNFLTVSQGIVSTFLSLSVCDWADLTAMSAPSWLLAQHSSSGSTVEQVSLVFPVEHVVKSGALRLVLLCSLLLNTTL